jgi:carbamoyl-phosphate synthase large subunit
MPQKKTVLVTGAGAPGIAGTLNSIKENEDEENFRIVTTDIKDNVVGKFLSDSFYIVPPPENENYVDDLKQIIKKEEVHVIIPQTTREIEVLSKYKSTFLDLDCKVMVSDTEAISKANDKYNILLEALAVNVPVPNHQLVKSKEDFYDAVYNLGFPERKVVVKPRFSNGSRGVRIVTNEKATFKDFLNNKPSGMEVGLDYFEEIFESVDDMSMPDLLVTEYLPGVEYTVDVLRLGEQIQIIPRLRQVIRSGISFESIIDMEQEKLIRYSNKLSVSTGLNYCFGFQFKLDEKGIPKILESNPRIQGTMIASKFAGCNIIYLALKHLFNENVNINQYSINNRVEFKRYWGGVGIEAGKYKGSF